MTPENPPEPIALDVHAHLVPVDGDGLRGIDGVDWDAARRVLVVDGHPLAVRALYEPPELLRWMDAHRVERAWISIPPPLYRPQLERDASLAWTRYVNAGLRRIAGRHPDRLEPLAHLPLEHPDVAIAAAAECIEHGTLRSTSATRFAAAAGGHRVPTFSDPALTPLWEALDRASAFVFIHPGRCCDGRLGVFYLDNLLGNPNETAVAAAHLVFGGIAERYARIRFCLAHAGGATAILAGRWQRGWETARPGVDRQREAPERALRRLWVDCIAHGGSALALAAGVFGDDHIVFGSDWPFPMGLLEPDRQLSAVDSSRRRMIVYDNAQSLLP